MLKRIAGIIVALLALAAPALAQTPFVRVSASVTLAVTSVSANVAIGTSARISNLWICNTGANDAYLFFGDSTVVADTTGTILRSGVCGNISPDGKTTLAAVTASSSTTLVITPGSGVLFGTGGGSSSGGGGGVVTPGNSTSTLAAWTSATAGNNTQSLFSTGGWPALILQLDQTTTLTGGVMTIEGSFDATNWVTVPVAQVLNPNTLAPLTNPYTLVASTNQPFLILTQGYQAVRIKLSTVITGSATVTPFVTLLPYNPTISGILNPLVWPTTVPPVKIDQTTPGTTNGVTLPSQYPFGAVPIAASATGTTTATTATLAASALVKTYICGMSIRANATAAATNNATITGTIAGTLNFTQWTAPNASGLGVTEQIFSPCVPSSAINTAIAVVSGAPGTSGVVSVSAWGYQL